MTLERIADPNVEDNRFGTGTERTKELSLIQYEPLAFRSGRIMYFDAYIEAEYQEGEIKAKAKASTNAYFIIKIIQFKLGISYPGRLVRFGKAGGVSVFLKGPHIAPVQEDGTMDKPDQLFAQLKASFQKDITGFFETVIEQTVTLGVCA